MRKIRCPQSTAFNFNPLANTKNGKQIFQKSYSFSQNPNKNSCISIKKSYFLKNIFFKK